MNKHQMHEEKEAAYFREIASYLKRSLRDDGYQVLELEAQQWAVALSLSHSNIDGSVVIFAGPFVKTRDPSHRIPFLLMGQTKHQGSLSVSGEHPAEETADLLLRRIEAVLQGVIQAPHFVGADVGRGLISRERADREAMVEA